MLKKYGWRHNPFNPNIPEPDFLIYKKQTIELIEKIKENRLLWVCAPMGSGKTTILKYLLKNASKYKLRAIYWHFGYNPSLDDFKLRCKKLKKGLFGHRANVILIDEANYIADKNFFRYLVGLLDDEKFCPSIVFASVTPPPKGILFETFKDRHIENCSIQHVSEDKMIEMIKARVKKAGGVFPFDENSVKNIVRESETPRMVLEKLMMLASQEKEKKIEKTGTLNLENLSDQQKKIIQLLSAHPMPAKEIAEALSTTPSGIRGQLNRLSSMDFLKQKGCRMPVVEKKNGKWQIHPEFKVASNPQDNGKLFYP